ncbi:transcriptional regulator [Streptomyces sp. SGAir0957]
MGRALNLDVRRLLQLWEAAYGRGMTASVVAVPGKPIGHWDPYDLEVHPAAVPPTAGSGHRRRESKHGRYAELPAYVRRGHDEVLATVVTAAQHGRSRMAMLVGASSTGKTRACWEAVQPLASAGWRLWHPFDPTRRDAVLADINRVAPHTIVWLNDAHQYFGANDETSERISAAVHGRLTDRDRGPVLILGTLWPEHAKALTELPQPGRPDPYARVRELLAGRLIDLPDSFDDTALREAGNLAAAGDQQLAYALQHMENRRLTQFLAGVPELVRSYATASAPERALLHAAMDARRLGAGMHLPVNFLERAAEGYLDDVDYDDLSDDWLNLSLMHVTRPVHGRLAPLRRIRPRPTRQGDTAAGPTEELYRLADYLEQQGRRRRAQMCPPDSFWQAAYDHLATEDLTSLADSARSRNRLQWAERLARKAAASGNPEALVRMAEISEAAGAREEADRLLQRAAEYGNVTAMLRLAVVRERTGRPEEAERFARRAAAGGDPRALARLAEMREELGKREEAEQFAQEAAQAGFTSALVWLAEMRELAGAHQGAERLCQWAANAGNSTAYIRLAVMREAAGARNGAQRLYQGAARVGNASALVRLSAQREAAGDRHGAERFASRAADAGQSFALVRIAEMRDATGAQAEAEELAQKAIQAGHRFAATRLAALRQARGDLEGAERLYQLALRSGIPSAVARICEIREQMGDVEEAENIAIQAVRAGNPSGASRLADSRECRGDREGAERLAKLAAGVGDNTALARIAEMRELAGEKEDSERLALLSLETGTTSTLVRIADMRESSGDLEGAELLLKAAAENRDTYALGRLAIMREIAGDQRAADDIARRAADAGNPSALLKLFDMRREMAKNKRGGRSVADEKYTAPIPSH